ncbi:hypothetical protein WJX72_006763 [[Myrmecia] bisecta]|uniref:Uncharacterized protein n=1 Tax=[Myrmecia] bisecta TaxID=41462 RepID=A0AAW1P1G7_9CHLO
MAVLEKVETFFAYSTSKNYSYCSDHWEGGNRVHTYCQKPDNNNDILIQNLPNYADIRIVTERELSFEESVALGGAGLQPTSSAGAPAPAPAGQPGAPAAAPPGTPLPPSGRRLLQAGNPQFVTNYEYVKGLEDTLLEVSLLALTSKYVRGTMTDSRQGGTSDTMRIELVDQDGATVNLCNNFGKPSWSLIDSCTQADPFTQPCSFQKEQECNAQILRRLGARLLVNFDYDNMEGAVGAFKGPFVASTIQATIRVQLMASAGALGVEAAAGNSTSMGTYYGLTLQTSHTGSICGPSFSTLLTTLTSAVSLLAVATTVTSLAMTYVVPARELYLASVNSEVSAATVAAHIAKKKGMQVTEAGCDPETPARIHLLAHGSSNAIHAAPSGIGLEEVQTKAN